MKVYYSDAQLAHDPRQYMVTGRIVAPLEVPERARRMAGALTARGLEVVAPPRASLEPIEAVHAPHYVAFLGTAYERFQALKNAGPEVLANVHPYRGAGADYASRPPPRAEGIIGQAGWYLGDLAVAMGAGTFAAAKASADAAIAAACEVRDGAAQAMALCRPPGHHAYADRASGFCFLNNAAIAAEILRQRFSRVAILDFDTHHGDGTQALFYRRDDVFFGSTHTDPANYYPFFAGYADERGAGRGDGFTLNVPLAPGSGDDELIAANRTLVVAALAAGAEAIVISAGWDAHKDDPLSRLAVTTDAYRALGDLYGEIPLPTVIVQEGGYSLAAIAEAAPQFVGAFLNERKVG